MTKPIYKSAIYDWVDHFDLVRSHDQSGRRGGTCRGACKTRARGENGDNNTRALRSLEKMTTWKTLTSYFPRYAWDPRTAKKKLEAQLEMGSFIE